MNEQLLTFIWKNYYFDTSRLETVNHKKVQIIDLGQLNHDAGADFENACILIDGVKWYGTVEIHRKTSDWLAHQHSKNQQYDTVILHVVYENDLPENSILRSDHSPIPVLELKARIDVLIIEKYALLNNADAIPCQTQLGNVPDKIIKNTQDNVLITRLSRKANDVRNLLQQNQFDWEETFYQRLAEHFGFKKNNAQFLRIAKALPRKIILKHIDNQVQIQSLFFGQAGFLEGIEKVEKEEYIKILQKEYGFLAHKYQLADAQLKRSNWKFMRMRPANFPTVRLAQLMSLVCSENLSFTTILSTQDIHKLRKLFIFQLPDYWQKHYDFGKEVSKSISFGKSSIDNLILNVICPILVCYGQEKDQPEYVQKALQILTKLPAENNKVTRLWNTPKIQNRNAYESQALLELYNNFCTPKKCLDCQIGKYLLTSGQKK